MLSDTLLSMGKNLRPTIKYCFKYNEISMRLKYISWYKWTCLFYIVCYFDRNQRYFLLVYSVKCTSCFLLRKWFVSMCYVHFLKNVFQNKKKYCYYIIYIFHKYAERQGENFFRFNTLQWSWKVYMHSVYLSFCTF